MPQPRSAVVLPFCALVAAWPVRAADVSAPGGGPAPAAAAPASGGAEPAMAGGMERMRRQMAAAPVTGDPDRDFVAMMLPHHAGAIDMAQAELRHGRDPALRRLARGIVAAQEREMRQMRAWSAAHPAS